MAGEGELHLWIRRDADQTHGLQVGAVGIAGFKPRAAELVLQVSDREFFPFGSGTTSFELIGGKRADIRQHAIAGN